jgi:hypothetical protein
MDLSTFHPSSHPPRTGLSASEHYNMRMPRFPRSKLPSFTNWRHRPSDLARVDLRGHRTLWFVQLAGKLIVLCAILTAIGFGGSSRNFSVTTKRVLGSTVDADLQLAFLGLINKIMDLLITKALQITAGVVVTLWMTRQKSEPGVRLADFDLGEELTKPWEACAKFSERWSTFGWKRAGWRRLLVTLPLSVCVLLQGLAINTIGVPKERWYPEPWQPDTAAHPIAKYQGLDWMNFWHQGFLTVGGGDNSWRAMDGYIASSTYLAFQDFTGQMNDTAGDPKTYGWRHFTPRTDYAALDTRHNKSTSFGIAFHDSLIVDTFKWLQANGTPNSRRAIGVQGNMKMAVPSTLVSCRAPLDRSAMEAPSPDSGSVTVDDARTSTMFQLHFRPILSSNFSGVSCDVNFRRVLFPFNIWIINEDAPWTSVNEYNQRYDVDPEAMEYELIDTNITNGLSHQLRATVSRLDNFLQDMNTAQWLLAIARELRSRRPEYISDAEALSPVTALLTNHLLTIAQWGVTLPRDGEKVDSTPLRWQLYGSGPRLPWAWAAVAILAILATALIASLTLSFWHRIVPGEWLRPAGMLVAANSSLPISGLADALDLKKDRSELGMLRIRLGVATPISVVSIVNAERSNGDFVNPNDQYQWTS